MSESLEIARLAYTALSSAERAKFWDICGLTPVGEQAQHEPERIMRRKEVAELAGTSVRTIDKWAAQGLIRKVKLPGHEKAIGFRVCDVASLLGGRSVR